MSDTYNEFLQTKHMAAKNVGFEVLRDAILPVLFDFQKDLTIWALRKGRAAIFADTGLGKTPMQIEWAFWINKTTNLPVLIIAPLSVSRQTVRIAKEVMGIDVVYMRDDQKVAPISITNYEMIEHFDPAKFAGIVLDESSILKSLGGKTRKLLTSMFEHTPYKLACTATPAPNDNTEIGNHAEFLGICTMAEMLAEFFVNANHEHTYFDDAGKSYRVKGSNKGGQEWRLKHHAEQTFFQWLASWSIMMTKPSDLGYDDDGFILPPLNITTHYVDVDYTPEDQLCFTGLRGVGNRAKIRRGTVDARLVELQKLVNGNNEQWIVWTGLDNESKSAVTIIDGAIEVKGSNSPEYKMQALEDFQDNKIRVLITKSKIAGFGMNFQNAHNMVFFGLNDSWEQWYQSISRELRYGQTETVNVHVILSSVESGIYKNILRKDAMAKRLRNGLVSQVRQYEEGEIKAMAIEKAIYQTNKTDGENWTAYLGDSCEVLKEIPDNSIDLSVYSPPFEDLFTYSDSPRDLGNSRGSDEFFAHYAFIVREILRVTKPGRLTCVHTSDIPAMMGRDGYIGIKDFPGHVIRAYEAAGWTFHGRAFVQKNPQAQAIRTHSKGLLFVQLRKDSTDSRPALIDQVLMFKKDGENAVPVNPVANGDCDNETWIEWAHGIWLGIFESDTLQFSTARAPEDEKHICPLQLGTIERCIKLYSNPGETVLTPFLGIGSEAYQAVRFGRKAIGIELKPSYYEVAVNNLYKADTLVKSLPLFIL